MLKKWNLENDISLGIEYGDYDKNITASSQQWEKYFPIDAKLNSPTSWCPSSVDKDNHPWIQVNFKDVKFITSITLQGRKDADQYVTKFRILYSKDGSFFEHLEQFPGLSSVNETIKRWFTIPVYCKAIRLQALEYNNHPSLRFELGYIPDYLAQIMIKNFKNNETPK